MKKIIFIIVEVLIIFFSVGLTLGFTDWHKPHEVGIAIAIFILWLRSMKARSDALAIARFIQKYMAIKTDKD